MSHPKSQGFTSRAAKRTLRAQRDSSTPPFNPKGSVPTLVPTAQGTLTMATNELPINEVAKSLATQEFHAAIKADATDAEVAKGLLFATGTEGYSRAKGDGSLDFVENYTAQWDACVKDTLPAGEAADKHGATIAAENRADVIEPIQAWRVNLDGKLQRFQSGVPMSQPYDLRDTAHKQICQATKAPAYNANAGLASHKGRERRIRVRRLPEGSPEIYAVTGGPGDGRAYAPFDSDKLVDALRQTCPDTRLKVDYDAATTECRVKAYFMAPLDLLAFGAGVGRVHHVYTDWRTADNGTMSLTGQMGIVRAVCRNSGLGHHEKASVTLRHSGDYARLAEAVATLNAGMQEVIANLQEVWGRALAAQYLDSESGSVLSPSEAIARLVKSGAVPTAGLKQDEAIERYQDAWHREPVYSAGGILMAIQRAAHEAPWSTKWAEDEIEASASELLYQHVWNLDEPTAEA